MNKHTEFVFMYIKLNTIYWKIDSKYAMEILNIKLCHLQLLNIIIYTFKRVWERAH